MEPAQRSELQRPSSPSSTDSLTSYSSALTSQSTPSSFLRLSPELRNQIYQHIYASSTVHVGVDTPGLLLTNRQSYSESIDLFYSVTAFYVEDWDALLKWLKHLPPARRKLIVEIWCGQDMALPDAPKENVTRHGVLKRMGLRLRRLGLALGAEDTLRSRVWLDNAYGVWSSDPMLAAGVANKAWEERQYLRKPRKYEHLPYADAVRLHVMEKLHELSEGQAQHTIAPLMVTREDRLRFRFLRL